MYFDYKSVVKGINKKGMGWLSKYPGVMSGDNNINAT